MFVLLTQILFIILIVVLILQLWQQTGGDNTLVVRIIFLLILAFALIAFFDPTSQIGSALVGILSFILKPLGLAIILLLNAAALINKKGIKSPAPTLLFLAILILIVCSTPFVAYWLAEQAEKEAIVAIRANPCCSQTGDAIVLLGQGTTQPNIASRFAIQLTESSDRIPYAARLYRENVSPFVIISAGPRPNMEGHLVEAMDVKTLLVYMGVRPQSIILESKGVNVRTSALEVKRILDQHGLGSRILLVTSALQIRRASLAFADVGIKVIPTPTDFYSFEPNGKIQRRITSADFVPSVDALVITTRVIDEYLTGFYYLLRGWLAPSV